jgi:DNA-binding Lrp family transcriptional regulator
MIAPIRLDAKDRTIIGLLNEKPDISQEEIAEHINLSQPSVAMRIKKLRDKGFIEQIIGINPHKIGFHIAKLEITADTPSKILNMFRDCPFFLNGFTVSGKNNLCLLFIGEDIASLESIVDVHLRTNKEIHNVDFNIIISSLKNFVTPVNMKIDIREKPPCGIDIECSDCTYYKENRCVGCPIINQYRGLFW